jgi:transcriptional regulator PpsR
MSTDPNAALDLSALSPLAKELAQAMAQVGSDIALVIDSDGVIRDVAEGGPPQPARRGQWVGRRWVDTASADTRRKIELLLDDLSNSGVTQRREVNHPSADGDEMPFAWTAIRLGAQGQIVAVGRDLRAVAAIQRRFLDAQHEMELDYWQRRHADSRYRLLFQVASDAVLVVDANSFELIEANDAAQDLFAVREASRTDGLPALLPEAARAPLSELLNTARSSGRAGEIRLRLTGPGPDWDISATPFSAGPRHQILLRARRHEAGRSGDAAPAMMRSLVEQTPDAVVITDAAGHVLMANPAFVSLVAQGAEARLKGRLLTDIVSDGGSAHWRDAIARTRLHGLCLRVPLAVTVGALSLAVEVSSTLLAEGEQEHLGFTLRCLEPAAEPGVGALGWPELAALQAQLGRLPLDALIREGALALERQLIRAALARCAGHVSAAAQVLQVDPQTLSDRVQQFDLLASGDGDVDTTSAVRPPTIN